jgi:hypothetical protein
MTNEPGMCMIINKTITIYLTLETAFLGCLRTFICGTLPTALALVIVSLIMNAGSPSQPGESERMGCNLISA